MVHGFTRTLNSYSVDQHNHIMTHKGSEEISCTHKYQPVYNDLKNMFESTNVKIM